SSSGISDSLAGKHIPNFLPPRGGLHPFAATMSDPGMFDARRRLMREFLPSLCEQCLCIIRLIDCNQTCGNSNLAGTRRHLFRIPETGGCLSPIVAAHCHICISYSNCSV